MTITQPYVVEVEGETKYRVETSACGKEVAQKGENQLTFLASKRKLLLEA